MTMEFPIFTARRDAKWKDVRYRELAFRADGLGGYCGALESIYVNGRCDSAVFEAVNRDDFFSANQFDLREERNPIESLLSSETVLQAFPKGLLDYGSPQEVEIFRQGGCQFEGLLADVLLRGGAYEAWKGYVADAKALASRCVSAIRSVAHDRPWVPYLVRGPWCSYFHDVAWDYTFVVQFPYDALWFVLCATDTD